MTPCAPQLLVFACLWSPPIRISKRNRSVMSSFHVNCKVRSLDSFLSFLSFYDKHGTKSISGILDALRAVNKHLDDKLGHQRLRNLPRRCAWINLEEGSSSLVRIVKQSMWEETESSCQLPGPTKEMFSEAGPAGPDKMVQVGTSLLTS